MLTQIRNAVIATLALLLFALRLPAQMQVGDDLTLQLNGSLAANYSGENGNEIASSRGFGFGGTAALTGSFYDPNFLSFNVDPYFNQSRANSNFGSLTDASGVTVSSAIFSGSHFPGTFNYSKAYNSTGNYGLPGISSFDTNSNSQSFGIGWSAVVPNLPSVSAGFQRGSDDYSLYGSHERGGNNFHSLFLNSNYRIAGFSLGGGASFGGSSSSIPQLVTGVQQAESNSDSKSYNFNVSHMLPLRGTASSSFTRSDVNSDYLGYRFNGTIDRWTGNAGIHPTPKLTFSTTADYTDNLSGSIYQATIPVQQLSSAQLVSPAGTPSSSSTQNQQSFDSNGWDLAFNTTYAFAPNFQAQGEIERRLQLFEGVSYGSVEYSAGTYYTRQVLGGYFGSSVNVFENQIDNSKQSSLGFSANSNYNRRIGAWQVGGYFNYAQNAQTLLVSYTTSFYNFSGNVGRNFGRLHWTAGGAVGRSGLTAQPDTSSSSESLNSSIGTSRINLSGTYSKANGNSLAGTGLVPLPVPVVVPSPLLVAYGGNSYSLALSGSPVRDLSAAAAYVKARNTLDNQGVASWNSYEQVDFFTQYHFRQINLTGGYARLVQGFSASGLPPANVNSFSIGVSRWFNFF